MRKTCLKISLLYVLLIYCSCATPPPPQKPVRYIFFPTPPETPRIQFLTSITEDKDFITSKTKSSFADFVLGKKKKKEKRRVIKPYGVAIKDGVIYVCDTDLNRIDVLDLQAETFTYIGGTFAGKFIKPINIVIDPEGNKYVADSTRGAVVVLDKDNQFTDMYGKEELTKPTGVAIYGNKLFVADVLSNTIAVFNKDTGKLLYKIARKGDPLVLQAPTNLTVNQDGDIYVSETFGFRIQKLTQDGRPIKIFGRGLGDGFGQFARPRGVAVDRDGRVYSVDAKHNVVQIFDKEGNILLFFGQTGNEPGNLFLPAQVVIDYDNISLFAKYIARDFEVEYLILVTSQYGLRKVNIFGFGHKKEQVGEDT